MNFPKLLLKAAAALFVVGFVLACVFCAHYFTTVDPYHLKAPGDAKLLSLFQQHHQAFERLRQMAAEDSKNDRDFRTDRFSPQLCESRREDYRRLLSEIDPGLVLFAGGFQGLVFSFASGGSGPIGDDWYKGIAFVTGKPEAAGKMEASLDDWRKLPTGDYYLRPVEGKWFLFYTEY